MCPLEVPQQGGTNPAQSRRCSAVLETKNTHSHRHMGALHVATLAYIFAFYGVFVCFIAAGTFEPCTIAEGFDVSKAECAAGWAVMAKVANGPNLVHTFTVTTRIEGALWGSIGITAGLAIIFTSLRPGAYLSAAMGCFAAALMHLQHQGLLGPTPWHATKHPFNNMLILFDTVGGVLCVASLLSNESPGKKSSKAA